ncbi:AzlC family ABC transporter permease [Halobacteriovorax sp.]|uniref:AzlC family ABC transporter permease n=1 Tax=Halobacteriovorax sp. TaxID=2020862 RepID=UPI003563CBCE
MQKGYTQFIIKGSKAMLPIIPAVLPFGLIMGAVGSTAELSGIELGALNTLVFAGASQLVAVDLLMKDVPSSVIIITGLVINLRMILYSVSLSEVLKDSSVGTKTIGAYLVTDQAYAVYTANSNQLKSKEEKVPFYIGAALCMSFSWQLFVLVGFIFGNFLPSSLNLDFAVPLSFIALAMPTLRNKKYYYVALASSILSILFYNLPYNLGLLASGAIAMLFGSFLLRKKQ